MAVTLQFLMTNYDSHETNENEYVCMVDDFVMVRKFIFFIKLMISYKISLFMRIKILLPGYKLWIYYY